MYDFRRGYGSPDKVDPVKMTALFLKLRKRFHPVMRHYFTEATKNPSVWFRMRLYYARSVATTSIVGHMIGLGDRHLSNILLDKRNGEVIHIDLGIAFEQVSARSYQTHPRSSIANLLMLLTGETATMC